MAILVLKSPSLSHSGIGWNSHDGEWEIRPEMLIEQIKSTQAVIELSRQHKMAHEDALSGGHLPAGIPWAEKSLPIDHLGKCLKRKFRIP